jgi:hypothetical protein
MSEGLQFLKYEDENWSRSYHLIKYEGLSLLVLFKVVSNSLNGFYSRIFFYVNMMIGAR